jgi:S1-C subfamily serine protease
MRTISVSVALLAMLAASGCRRTTELRRLTAVQVADRARPATFTIVTQLEANVEVHELAFDKDKLASGLKARLSGGNHTHEQVYKALFDFLLSDPGSFLSETGSTRVVNKTISSIGTGLAITPNGYVVTNAHVVEPEEEDLKKVVVSSIADLVAEDVDKVRKTVDQELPGSDPGKEAEERLKSALEEHYAHTSRIAGLNRNVSAVMGYTSSGTDVSVRRISCEVKKAGTPIPGKDVAILKMEGDDFPTIPLAAGLQEGDVRTGADLFVLGYPGDVALNPNFSLPSRLEPSLTTGHVSGIKGMADGWKVIQTDAAINPGNSGGPVLNDKGEVIGLATFTIRGREGGPVTQGLNFVVSIDVVNEFLNELNVRPSQSRFSTKYLAALNAWEGHNTGTARRLFRELNEAHPESSAVQDFVRQLGDEPIQSAQARPITDKRQPNTKTERTSDPGKTRERHPGFIILFVAVVLALILTFVILANRN